LNTPVTHETTKAFARGVAERMAREHSDLIVSRMEKRLRSGKVLVDWSQNDRNKTTVCAYSLRAKERPTVSTPVEWSEAKATLEKGDQQRLMIDSAGALKRVEQRGDLFQPVLKLKQRLPAPG
jgi:bifunctional non-homologous end joining protein LigD